MQGKHWIIVVATLALAVIGCRDRNPYHCPEGKYCPDGGGGGQCDELECRAPTPVCDPETMACVECVDSNDCALSRPVCSGQKTCVECSRHDQCSGSQLCLLDQTCADPSDVAYVGGLNTSNSSCTKAAPCQNLEQALTLNPLRRYIKVTGPISHNAITTIDNKRAIIYGQPGAQLSATIDDTVLLIKGTSEVTLIDLDIVGRTAGNGKDCVEIAGTAVATMTRVNVYNHGQAGVLLSMTAKLTMIDSQVHDNVEDGVKAASGTTLELRRSLIYNNAGTAGVFASGAAMVTIDSSTITSNTGTAGGVSITGPFSIRNSIISANGHDTNTTLAGGLTLSPGLATNAKFEFNTVADNRSAGPTKGLTCTTQFPVTNSILTGNDVSGCTVEYSLTGVTGTPTGTNKTGDPKFVTTTLLAEHFYRLNPGSEARDSADPAATLDVDIDGEPRNDARKDMGADELKE